jgi:hypothetical protein
MLEHNPPRTNFFELYKQFSVKFGFYVLFWIIYIRLFIDGMYTFFVIANYLTPTFKYFPCLTKAYQGQRYALFHSPVLIPLLLLLFVACGFIS